MESKPLPLKLAAILYADVAEYSRLTGEDEQGTHRRLSEYLDLISKDISRHNGRVVHYAGDAVLADFGTVVDALVCAASVQRELSRRSEAIPEERKVRFRIGVNLGDVIEDRGDIYGDGVNVAARLESLAEPGGICISESVHGGARGQEHRQATEGVSGSSTAGCGAARAKQGAEARQAPAVIHCCSCGGGTHRDCCCARLAKALGAS
jgi:class 3 adenylate cyclase